MRQVEDLTGKRFGYWVVLGLGERSKTGLIRWKCRCDCGRVRDVKPDMLKSGRSVSCGCGIAGKRNRVDELIGRRFGRLVVLEKDTARVKAHNTYWICKCDCGKEKSVATCNLIGGNVSSCGCLRIEQGIKRIKKAAINNITHGEAHTPLYEVWHLMKQRCENPNNPGYKWYGAKGICVCDEWKDYIGFSNWAYSNGYKDIANVPRSQRLSIDRIDSNGNYCPENCQWITVGENTRRMLNERWEKKKYSNGINGSNGTKTFV